MNLAQNVWLDDFQVKFEIRLLGGQKLGHQAKSKENLVNSRGHIFEAIIMNLA